MDSTFGVLSRKMNVLKASRSFPMLSFSFIVFFFLHVDGQLSQEHLLKSPSLLHYVAFVLCQRPVDYICKSLSGSVSCFTDLPLPDRAVFLTSA